ncbi:MAG: hypothetical protein ACYTEX_23420 [Planctomycetota bacterium]
MTKRSNIMLRALGLLLLAAAILKGVQLLTEPVAHSDIWSSYSRKPPGSLRCSVSACSHSSVYTRAWPVLNPAAVSARYR